MVEDIGDVLSINQGSLAVAATLMCCAPVFVYLTFFTLKLESPTALKWTYCAGDAGHCVADRG